MSFVSIKTFIFLPSLPLFPAATVQETPVLALLLTTTANVSSDKPEPPPREAVII